jgi:hypothetical protein
MMATIKKGTVTLEKNPYRLMTVDIPCENPEWIEDKDLNGKADVIPYRETCFAPGVTVRIILDGRYYYRKLKLID